MESALDWHSAFALLDWQVELGADEAIGDTPVDRFALAEQPVAKTPAPAPEQVVQRKEIDAVEVARQAATGATDLGALKQALGQFEHCELKRGARSLVFADGHPAARVLILGDAPDRDADGKGRPFVGPLGDLLDRMLAAIDLNRASKDAATAVYLTNVLPWRPPQNRDPQPEEIAMLLPFVQRHIDLVNPEFIVLMGNMACGAALGEQGITRLRGTWVEAFGRPALPMFHPDHLLRNTVAKRDAWADLLSLKVRLEERGAG